MKSARCLTVIALASVAVVVGGCGLGAGKKESGARVTVTHDFGVGVMGEKTEKTVSEGDTVMRVLQRGFDVKTASGGKMVQAIDGHAGDAKRAWFYYVNGVQASTGAAERTVSSGDHIWWDEHEWGTAMNIPAVVGSFPEPFKSGVEGKRLPVRLDCAKAAATACDVVHEKLKDAGVHAPGKGAIGQSAGAEVLRVVVGEWTEIRRDPSVRLLEKGVKTSGVFAQPNVAGSALALLDTKGKSSRVLRGGAGLIAATRYLKQQPTWVVTGVDDKGVLEAAQALTDKALRGRFAVAVEHGKVVGLPVTTK